MMFGYSFLNTDFTLVEDEDEDVEDLTNDKPEVDKSKRRITLSAAAKRVTDTSSLPLPSSPSHGLLFRRHRYNRRCSVLLFQPHLKPSQSIIEYLKERVVDWSMFGVN
ncbi:hypothetical protein ACFE04_029786 [Oxalis oulophora]